MSQYQIAKLQFLDGLKPEDFRNPSSFNQAEIIINQLNKSALASDDSEQFILKATGHLFCQNSTAVEAAFNLFNLYRADKGVENE